MEVYEKDNCRIEVTKPGVLALVGMYEVKLIKEGCFIRRYLDKDQLEQLLAKTNTSMVQAMMKLRDLH